MPIENHALTLFVQTVRLPHGRDQFVVPTGCLILRGQLLTQLDQMLVEASHNVVQLETGREGVERLIVLGADRLTMSQQEDLRAWLRNRLTLVPSVIDDVEQQKHLSSGKIPASSVLGRWQDEIRTRFPLPATGKTNVGVPKSNYWSLFVMSGLGLMAVAMWMMVPPISEIFRGIGPTKNGTSNDDISTLITKEWNVTNDKIFEGEDDLLKLLDPLVAPTPTKPNRNRLTHVLRSINQVRLGNVQDTVIEEAESDDKLLRQLLRDQSLNSYVRKLISKDGIVDHFGQVVKSNDLADLKQLLPKTVDEKTATTFRRLAMQLIGKSPIGPEAKTLLDEEDPFFDFADQSRKAFDRMVRSVPKSLSDAPNECTFFAEDDCMAAREITTYFKSIGYLDDHGLGFPSSDPRSKRLVTNSYRPIARLLNDWKAFTLGKPNDPRPNQSTNNKPPVTEIP